MKVVLTDSFFKSLKKLRNRNRWPYRAWNFVRYDLPRFFKNVWKFRKELWNHFDWDSGYSLRMLKRSLELLSNSLQNGSELEFIRNKKIVSINRAIKILTNVVEDSYIEMAEKQLGIEVDTSHLWGEEEPIEIKEAHKKIFDLAADLERKEWLELFRLLEGQDPADYKKYREANPDKADCWQFWYDGSGMKFWWD